MSSYIDRKYITIISSQLENFVWKSDDLANCRCPVCGDSQTNSRKARGFFINKVAEDFFYYMCHKCSFSSKFGRFLRDYYNQYYSEYRADMYMEKMARNRFNKKEQPAPVIKVKTPVFKEKSDKMISVRTLPEDHPAMVYLKGRMLESDKLSDVYYTEDFKGLVSSFSEEKAADLYSGDRRIVFPMRRADGSIFGVVGRSMGATGLRYATIKFDDSHVKVYGLDRLDTSKTFYVAEGPIDSLFLNNCIASCGTYLSVDYIKSIGDGVVVLDNQPRHPELIEIMLKYARSGVKIAVWKNISSEFKDINDMILNGYSPESIENHLKNNTFSGLKAINEINYWKKR